MIRMFRSTPSWGLVAAAVAVLLLGPAAFSPALASDDEGFEVEAGKYCGCPDGYTLLPPGDYCFNVKTGKSVPYCREGILT